MFSSKAFFKNINKRISSMIKIANSISSIFTWGMAHFGRLLKEYKIIVMKEALIPAGTTLDYVPKKQWLNLTKEIIVDDGPSVSA